MFAGTWPIARISENNAPVVAARLVSVQSAYQCRPATVDALAAGRLADGLWVGELWLAASVTGEPRYLELHRGYPMVVPDSAPSLKTDPRRAR